MPEANCVALRVSVRLAVKLLLAQRLTEPQALPLGLKEAVGLAESEGEPVAAEALWLAVEHSVVACGETAARRSKKQRRWKVLGARIAAVREGARGKRPAGQVKAGEKSKGFRCRSCSESAGDNRKRILKCQ